MTSRFTTTGVVTGNHAELADAAARAIEALSGVPRQSRRSRVADLIAALTLDLDKDFLIAA